MLLQRFAQIVGALAQFLEQASVLDGNYSLGGEALDQLDMLVSEWAVLSCASSSSSMPSVSVLQAAGSLLGYVFQERDPENRVMSPCTTPAHRTGRYVAAKRIPAKTSNAENYLLGS